MLTQEQINNLKKGDPLIIHGKFNNVDNQGDIWTDVDDCILWFSPSCISLPSEHGTSSSRRSSVGAETEVPTTPRLFQKGDKVRVVAWNGRDIARIGQIGRVVSDEYNSRVELAIDGWSSCIYYPACHLELVTPVEELEPYSVVDAHTHWDVADKDMKTVATYSKLHHPNAKAAAEAERDRLNAEYRKEQNND